MTRHNHNHDTLEKQIAETEASLKDFKQIRRDKREKDDSSDSVIKTSDHQANRMY